MIITLPPLEQKPQEVAEGDDREPIAPRPPEQSYEYNMVAADGVRLSDDQYFDDIDQWLRGTCSFEDLIKTKR